ncbi:MAG: TMEM175 family protein [Arcicella sp.]|nr:TMEM175 family protein [Arcicella sp.]
MKQQIPPHQQHQEDRQRFQVERMILFTDAVFAIAITLLILEIKVPNLEFSGLNSVKIKDTLFSQTAVVAFIGFFISFWVIALYWIDHHRTFAYVDNYDGTLVFLNLLFLMSITIMPFTSALYSRYINFSLPTQIYCFNVASTGFIKLWISYYIYNPKNKICKHPTDNIRKKYYLIRAWIAPIVFLITGLIAGYTIWSRLFFVVIFIIQFIIGLHFDRKHGLKERFK